MKDAKFMLDMTFFGHSVEFVLGMGLALWVARQPRQTSQRITYTVIGAGGTLLYMLVLALLYHFFPGHYYPVTEGPDWTYRLIFANNVMLPFIVCSLFRGLISEQTLLRRLLETKLFQLLGKASYVLYLIHLGTFDYLFRTYVSGNSLICLVAYTLVSIVLYKVVEHPLHQRLRAQPARVAVAA